MTLHEICENAMHAGRGIDLSGCDYGPHLRTQQHLGTQPYYHFLAGLVASLGMTRILEIGTSYGGSMMAMERGLSADTAGVQLVTVDKVDIAGAPLLARPRVVRLLGDSLAPATLKRVVSQFDAAIGLLYIDSKHSREHVLGNIALYGKAMRPRFVVLDDIHLNGEMEAVWAELASASGTRAFDASQIADRACGFGVLQYDGG